MASASQKLTTYTLQQILREANADASKESNDGIENGTFVETSPTCREVPLIRHLADGKIEPSNELVPDFNDLIKLNEDGRKKLLHRFGISYHYLLTIQTIRELQSYMKTLNLNVNVSHPGVWMLLVMDLDERNNYLVAMGCRPITDNKGLRNIEELINHVRQDEIFEMFQRFESFPTKNPPIDVTRKFLVEHDGGEEYKDIHKLHSLGGVLTLLEQRKQRYYVTSPEIWSVFTASDEQRKHIFSYLREFIKILFPSPKELLKKCKDRESNFKSVTAFRSWYNAVIVLISKLYYTREGSSAREKCRTILTAMLSYSVTRAKTVKSLTKHSTRNETLKHFGFVNILHMVDEREREVLLRRHGIEYSDIARLVDFSTLYKTLTYYSIVPKSEPKYYNALWSLWAGDKSECSSTISREISGLTNIGKFFDWLYLTKDGRKKLNETDKVQGLEGMLEDILLVEGNLKQMLEEIEAEQGEAEQGEAEQGEAEQGEAEQREAEQREAEQREAEQREAERKADKQAEKRRQKRARRRKRKAKVCSEGAPLPDASSSNSSVEAPSSLHPSSSDIN